MIDCYKTDLMNRLSLGSATFRGWPRPNVGGPSEGSLVYPRHKRNVAEAGERIEEVPPVPLRGEPRVLAAGRPA